MSELKERLEHIEARIEAARQRAINHSAISKLNSVKLICVSKHQPLSLMQQLERIYAERKRCPIFGENYVQEWKQKRPNLSSYSSCHLIGALQSNKARDAVKSFDLIQSVHAEALMTLLDKEAAKIKKIQPILLQVNISSDSAKHGFMPKDIKELLPKIKLLPNLRFLGLMTITALYKNPELARPDFTAMRELKESLIQDRLTELTSEQFELSMGMSQDYEIAISEGATMVRIGTALFGERRD